MDFSKFCNLGKNKKKHNLSEWMIQIFEVDSTKNYHLQNEHILTVIFLIRIHSLDITFFYGFPFYHFLGYHNPLRLACSLPTNLACTQILDIADRINL